MISEKYLLSILIPAYQYKEGLLKILNTLTKINEDKKKNIEIIVSDDSQYPLLSNDDIKYFKTFNVEFKYCFNKKRLGAINNWNNLISNSVGKYKWIIHHDECPIKPIEFFENLFKILEKSDVDILILPLIVKYLNIKKINLYRIHTPHLQISKLLLNRPELVLFLNYLGPPSVFIVKSDLNYKFDNRLKWLVDVEAYYKLFKQTRNIQIFKGENKFLFLLSNSLLSGSITDKLGSKINKLRIKELNLICRENNIKQINPILELLFKTFFITLRLIRNKLSIERFD